MKINGIQMNTIGYSILLIILLTSFSKAYQPEFAQPIENLTVPRGRDATFQCLVVHLGGYRVGWVKADTKAIQAIHDHVITHNPRVSVSHNDHTTWNLHIKSVIEEDQGQYMCQINTDPMQSQMGKLEVVVPPDFVSEETSGDLMIPEGGSARISCRARGSPTPRVVWRREDGKDIVLKESSGSKNRVTTYQGEVLMLSKITRSDMGAYLCIASNGVPPSVSKRIMVSVHFHPVIQVPNQLVGAPLGTDVTLECYVEASPKSINYWLRDNNEMVISSSKYVVHNTAKSTFESKMTLTVKRLQPVDVGGYRCIAKNSLGEVESNIRLYEIPGATHKTPSQYDEESDYETGGLGNQFGSAEVDDNDNDEGDDDAEGSNESMIVRGKNHSPPNVVQGRQPPQTPPSKGRSNISKNNVHFTSNNMDNSGNNKSLHILQYNILYYLLLTVYNVRTWRCVCIYE